MGFEKNRKKKKRKEKVFVLKAFAYKKNSYLFEKDFFFKANFDLFKKNPFENIFGKGKGILKSHLIYIYIYIYILKFRVSHIF